MRRRAVLGALLLVFGPLAAATPPAGHPAVHRFSSADGLPHDTVYAVARDLKGYLWIGTQHGAARFDGRRFTTFDMPDASTSNYVRDILSASDGSLWFARQNGGLVRLKAGRSTVFGIAEGLVSSRVNTVAEGPGPDGAPTVWAGLHAGGVCRLEGSRFVPVPSEAGTGWRVWRLIHGKSPGRAATLLAASESGLFALVEGRFVKVPLEGGTRAAFNSILSVQEDGAPAVYLGSYGEGVLRWSAGGLTRIDVSRGLPTNLVTALAATPGPGGRPVIWIGTRGGGLARADGDSARAVALDPRASEIFALSSGLGDGALWAGVRAYGLVRLSLSPFTALDIWSGLPSDSVSDIELVPRPGGVETWIATNRGLAVLRNGLVTVLDARHGLPGLEIGFLGITGRPERPDVWAGTLANGLVRFREGAPVSVLDLDHGFPTDRTYALLPSPEGLWVGTDLGRLLLVDPETARVIGEVPGLPRNEILNLARSADGTVWAANRTGLCAIRSRTVARVFTHADGLPNDEVLVLALLGGPDGGEELWAGTRTGVATLRLPAGDLSRARFVPLTGLPPNVTSSAVHAVLDDRKGNVYLGTHRGIVRVPRAGPATRARVFTTADGVPSNIANWGGLVDADGRVWISTTGGVAILDPELEKLPAEPAAPLVVESILRNERPASLPAGAELRHDEPLAIELALLSFAGEGAPSYRAQLSGLESRPSEYGPAPVFRFARLPAGRYVFRAWGRDRRGVESGPVELPFSVAEAPWRTRTAIALYVVTIMAAIAGVFRLRTAALHRRARELEAVVEARTRELVAARDQALAGSRTKTAFLANVSHELRTPLNAIIGYSELLQDELSGRADDALDDLAKIRAAAHLQLGLVNEILDLSKVEAGRFELHLTEVPIDELVAMVTSTVRPMIEKNRNRLEVSVSSGAGTIVGDRTRLTQVLLNLLSNASKFTKNGVVGLAVGRRAGARGEEVVFRVSDTGIGMTPEQMERLFHPFLQADASISATYGGTGLGLVIAKRFCELMGGDVTVESEKGRGSTFTAWVPVAGAEAPRRKEAEAPGDARVFG